MRKLQQTSKKADGKAAQSRDKIRLWVGLTLIVLCLAGVLGVYLYRNTDTRTVAYVDGLPIDVEEFKMAAERERAAVLLRLTDEWGVEAGPDFWETAHDGVVPADVLEKQALETAARMKLEQQWMAKAGILPDSSYAAFRQEWTAENASRQAAKARGEVVYGPVTFTEIQYYFFRQDKKTVELQSKLVDSELSSTMDEQMAFYRGDDPLLFKDGVRKPFEKVQRVICKRLAEAKFETIMEQKMAAAQLSVRQKLLDKIQYG